MARDREIITLVGSKQAKKGFMFFNEEPLNECKTCKLFKVCSAKLDSGRIYVVTEVRDKVLPCLIHEEGVQVVKVLEPNPEVNIESRLSFLGGVITFQLPLCHNTLCSYRAKCIPKNLKIGDKCLIVEVKSKVECPLNRHLVSAVVQRVVETAS